MQQPRVVEIHGARVVPICEATVRRPVGQRCAITGRVTGHPHIHEGSFCTMNVTRTPDGCYLAGSDTDGTPLVIAKVHEIGSPGVPTVSA
jgi:hypothetical protein